jgi:hypothetical protein
MPPLPSRCTRAWQTGQGERALTDEERAALVAAARTVTAVEGFESRFFEDPYELKIGRPEDAARGLEDRMQANKAKLYAQLLKGPKGFEEEAQEWAAKPEGASDGQELVDIVDYVLNKKTSEMPYPNGIRDKGRGGVMPAHFTSHEIARDAGLTEGEVFALRIYTTFVYKHMNGPLRDDARFAKREPVPLPALINFANDAIRKLRARRAQQEQGMVLWRGMRSVKVSKDSKFMKVGGTELAFMSTTSDLRVAVSYALSRHSLLFKLVPPTFMSVGAELQWLSAFANEAEVLYPPLTFLKPTGRIDRVDAKDCNGNPVTFTVVEVIPTFS